MVHSRWCTLLKAFIFKAVRCKSSFKSASVFCWLHESSCLWMGKDSTLETLHLCGHLEAWDPFAPFSSAWVPYWRVILANSCGQSVLRNKCPVSTASCLKGLCREAKLWVTLEKQRQEEASRWKGEMDQSIPPCPPRTKTFWSSRTPGQLCTGTYWKALLTLMPGISLDPWDQNLWDRLHVLFLQKSLEFGKVVRYLLGSSLENQTCPS